MLDGDGRSVSPDSPPDISMKWLYNQIISIVWCLDNSLSHTSKVYRATTTIFISFYIKFKYCFPVITHQDSITAAWKTLHNSSSRSHAQSMCTEVHTYKQNLLVLVFSY